MTAAEVDPVKTTIPAVDKSAFSASAQEVIQIDGTSSLAEEGVEVPDSTCSN